MFKTWFPLWAPWSTDRRKVYVNIRTHVPEELLQLDSETRTVQATNDHDRLKIYLYFSAPVLNSSTEILNSINISQGSLLLNNAKSLGNRRFGFTVSWFVDMISFKCVFLMIILSASPLLTLSFGILFTAMMNRSKNMDIWIR